jgi:putative flavoprotein involved in K+ transport
MSTETVYDVIIIGGGQSALAVAYYLRRTELRYLILDAEDAPGGAWRHAWNSLTLFSPALWSSLPGIIIGVGRTAKRTVDEVLLYLKGS